MPKLLSGGILREGGSGQFITLPGAQPFLGPSPSTGTGFTLVTDALGITSYQSSLGNLSFVNGVISSYVVNQDIRIQTAGTGTFVIDAPTRFTNNVEFLNTLTFFNIDAAGLIRFTNTTPASSTITGALVVSGGVGVGQSLYAEELYDSGTRVISLIKSGAGIGVNGSTTGTVGGPLVVLTNTGVLSLTAGTGTQVSSTTGNIVIWTSGNSLQDVLSAGNSATIVAFFNSTTNSISTTTGAVVVRGGLGVGGNIYAGGTFTAVTAVVNTLTVTSPASFNTLTYITRNAIYTPGGVGIGSDLTVGRDAIIYGNLTVLGTQTIITSLTQDVGRKVIALSTSSGPTILAIDSGISVGPISSPYITWYFDGVNSWKSTGNIVPATNNLYNLGSLTYQWANVYAGKMALSNTTSATNVTSGALTVAGGVGISSSLWVGNQANFNNVVRVNSTVSSTSTSTGALTIKGGLGVAGNVYAQNFYNAAGSAFVTQDQLGVFGVSSIFAGTDTTVSTTTGVILIWNTSTLQSITGRGNVTSNPIGITNATDSTSPSTGALTVTGGVGVSGNVNIGGNIVVNGNVTFNGTITSVLSTNTVLTDNILELHKPSTSSTWEINDGRDIGIKFSIFDTTGTNAFLGRRNDTGYLEWFGTGVEVADQVFTGTYGIFKTGEIRLVGNKPASNTASGTLQVIGGVGIQGSLYAGPMFSNGSPVLTNASLSGLGVTNLFAGTDTQVSSNSGDVTVWNTSTLASVTSRGASTNSPIRILNLSTTTNAITGALVVNGGIGVGGEIYIASTLTNTSTSVGQALVVVGGIGAEQLSANIILQAGSQVIGAITPIAGTGISITSATTFGSTFTFVINNTGVTATIGTTYLGVSTGSGAVTFTNLGVQTVAGTTYLGVSASTGSITLTNLGVQTLTAGTDTAVSSNTGTITVWSTGNLQSTTNRGATTNRAISITSATDASSTTTGALVVTGGVGIGKSLWVGSSSTLIGPVLVSNTTTSGSTNSGALQVVGGVGIGGNLYVGDNAFVNGAGVITTATLAVFGVAAVYGSTYIGVSSNTGSVTVSNLGVQTLTAGTDTAVSASTGTITVWNTSTLETVTGRGATSSNKITITNNSASTSTTTGALIVTGGLGVGKSIYVQDQIVVKQGSILLENQSNLNKIQASTNLEINSSGNIRAVAGGTITLDAVGATVITNSTSATNTTTGALQIAGGLAVGKDAFVGKLHTIDASAANVSGAGSLQIAGGAYLGNNLVVAGTQASTGSFTGNALYVAGGVGILDSLYVGGPVTFSSPVTFNGTATYVLSTNSFFTDNLIEIHTPPGGVYSNWNLDDGKDIGFRFHYFTNGTDTNAALVIDNPNKELHWYSSGAEDATGNFNTATFGVFKTGKLILASNQANSNNTTTGDLQVHGGAGIGGTLYVAGGTASSSSVASQSIVVANGLGVTGDSYFNGPVRFNNIVYATVTTSTFATTASNSYLATTATNLGGGAVGGIPYQSATGQTKFIGIGTTGFILQSNGTTATWVSTSTLGIGGGGSVSGDTVLVQNDLTTATTQYITFVNTSTGYAAVKVAASTSSGITYQPLYGSVGIGGEPFSTHRLYIQHKTSYAAVAIDGVSGSQLGFYSNGNEIAQIGADAGVLLTGYNVPGNNNLAIRSYGVISFGMQGAFTGEKIRFTNTSNYFLSTTEATSTGTGAVQVRGGVGIAGNVYANALYDQGNRVVTSVAPIGTAYLGVSQLTSTGTATTFTLTNLGVHTANGTTYLGVSSSTGSVTFTNLGVHQLSGTTYLGVSASTGSITLTNLGVQTLTAGTDTVVNSNTGTITVWNNSTLQTVTDRGNITTNTIAINNLAQAISTITGALVVGGGAGVGGSLYAGDIKIVSNAGSNSTITGALVVAGGAGFGGAVTAGNQSNFYTNSALSYPSLYHSVGAINNGSNTSAIRLGNSAADLYFVNHAGVLKITNSSTATSELLLVSTATVTVPGRTNASNTQSGALQVAGGAGIGGSLYATELYDQGYRVVTSNTIGIYGVSTLYAGTDTAVSSNTGTITVWNTSTLQTITNRGSTTTNSINITNSTAASNSITGALVVAGGVGIGGSVFIAGPTFSAPNSTATINWASINRLVVNQGGAINYGVLTQIGASTFNNIVTISTLTNASSSLTGALVVSGGVGIGLDMYVGGLLNVGGDTRISGNLYVDGTQFLVNSNSIQTGDKTITLSTGSTSTLTASGSGVQVGSTASPFISWLYDGGNAWQSSLGIKSNNTVTVYSTASSITTQSGAIVVSGGIGSGGDIRSIRMYANEMYDNGVRVLTSATFGSFGVAALQAGTDTAVSQSTGIVIAWNTSTLATITGRGGYGYNAGETPNAIYITNATASTSVGTGALKVTGGVGVQGSVNAGTVNATTSSVTGVLTAGSIVDNGSLSVAGIASVTTTTAATTVTNGALVVTGGVGIGGATYIGGLINVGGAATVGGTLRASGAITVGTTATASRVVALVSNAFEMASYTSNTISTTSTVNLDFDLSGFRTAKYMIQAVDTGFTPNRIHAVEMMIVNDGTNLYKSEYGLVTNSGDLGTFDVSAGQVTFTPSSVLTPTSLTIKMTRISM